MNVDLHFHFTPPFFLDELSRPNPWGKTLGGSGESLHMRFAGLEISLSPDHWDVDRIVARMDEQRIDLAAVSPSPLLFHSQWPAEQVVPLHRRLNQAFAELAAAHPTRFAPLGTVPVQDMDAALTELEHCMELGLAGVEIETQVGGRNLDDPSLQPLWTRAAELGAIVFLHPFAVLGGERLRSFYLANLIGNPTETAVAVASLIFGGVLDRCPDLKIVCAHGGGSTPALCGRWDHGARVRPELGHLKKLPSEALRNLYFDSLTHSSHALELLVRTVGADRVVLGSDYPWDMSDEAAVANVEHAAFLTHEERRMILGENALRLLGRA